MDSTSPAIVLSHASDAVTITAEPESLTIGQATTALVVVDMQNAYLSKSGYLDRVGFDVSTSAPVIDKAAAVLAAARGAGMFVIHLQNGFNALQTEAGGPTSPVWHKSNALKYMRANPAERGKLITHGTWDHDFVEPMRPIAGEAVIPKARYSGFAGTHLEQLLRARGITTIVLVGVNTNVCVEATLRDAYHREFFALMIPDATLQAGSNSIFEATVFNVTRFFGWVTSSEKMIAALASLPKRV
ncbi:isochorismatase family protein [Tardiphaga sp. P9-11]|jgi:ureidoacrylate peracid hydrolase|uniref:isochorismatase family protein n=1 Tax=Tardiphaga sp. P9-11 TaxID=2024614 RepID=UPI0011F0A3FD|nr:isochorismatase family protein [Tardiphaga sp. P9-11]KAA0070523.1 isochorismatase family protein [Tardiphaga sp. P9-11]